jgi:hypothetical protein
LLCPVCGRQLWVHQWLRRNYVDISNPEGVRIWVLRLICPNSVRAAGKPAPALFHRLFSTITALPDFVLAFKQFGLDAVLRVLRYRVEHGRFHRAFGINGVTARRWWSSLRVQCSGRTTFPSDGDLLAALRSDPPDLIARTARLLGAQTARECLEAVHQARGTHHRVYLSVPFGMP